jgi:hypothetical protein
MFPHSTGGATWKGRFLFPMMNAMDLLHPFYGRSAKNEGIQICTRMSFINPQYFPPSTPICGVHCEPLRPRRLILFESVGSWVSVLCCVDVLSLGKARCTSPFHWVAGNFSDKSARNKYDFPRLGHPQHVHHMPGVASHEFHVPRAK